MRARWEIDLSPGTRVVPLNDATRCEVSEVNWSREIQSEVVPPDDQGLTIVEALPPTVHSAFHGRNRVV